MRRWPFVDVAEPGNDAQRDGHVVAEPPPCAHGLRSAPAYPVAFRAFVRVFGIERRVAERTREPLPWCEELASIVGMFYSGFGLMNLPAVTPCRKISHDHAVRNQSKFLLMPTPSLPPS